MKVLRIDLDQVRENARQINSYVQVILQRKAELHGEIRTLPTAWTGGSADYFIETIQDQVSSLERAAEDLHRLSELLDHEVAKWEEVDYRFGSGHLPSLPQPATTTSQFTRPVTAQQERPKTIIAVIEGMDVDGAHKDQQMLIESIHAMYGEDVEIVPIKNPYDRMEGLGFLVSRFLGQSLSQNVYSLLNQSIERNEMAGRGPYAKEISNSIVNQIKDKSGQNPALTQQQKQNVVLVTQGSSTSAAVEALSYLDQEGVHVSGIVSIDPGDYDTQKTEQRFKVNVTPLRDPEMSQDLKRALDPHIQ